MVSTLEIVVKQNVRKHKGRKFVCHAEILKLKTLRVQGTGQGWGGAVDRENMVGVLMTKPGTNVEVLRPVSTIFIWSTQSQ